MKATSGHNEDAAAALSKARTSEDMKQTLQLCRKDKELAYSLAQELIDAKDAEAIADAFAAVAQEAATKDTEDPEAIMKAKVKGMISKAVMGGELRMSKIKDSFLRAAAKAKNKA